MITGHLKLDHLNTSGFETSSKEGKPRKLRNRNRPKTNRRPHNYRKNVTMRPSSNYTTNKLIDSSSSNSGTNHFYDKLADFEEESTHSFKRSLSLGPGDNPKFNPTVKTLKRMESLRKKSSIFDENLLGEIYIHEDIDIADRSHLFHERLDYENKMNDLNSLKTIGMI